MRYGYIEDHTCGRRWIGGIVEDGDEWGHLSWMPVAHMLVASADDGEPPMSSQHRDCDLTVEAAL